MPDQLRMMTFDINAMFELDRATDRDNEERLRGLLTRLDKLLAGAAGLTNSESIRQQLEQAMSDTQAFLSVPRPAFLSVPRIEGFREVLKKVIDLTYANPTLALNGYAQHLLRERVGEAQKSIQDFLTKPEEIYELDEKCLRESLGEKTQVLNEGIERELRRHLPPYISVVGNVGFEQGSIIVLGTVALLSWAGSIIFDATKDEAAKQLSELVKIAVRRSTNYIFDAIGHPSMLSRMDMTVVARDAANSTLIAAGKLLGEQVLLIGTDVFRPE
jgi:hypothetical protein